MELDSYQSHIDLVIVIFAQLFHRQTNIVILCVTEILVDISFLVWVNHLFYKVLDIQLRTRIYNRLYFL